MKIKFKMRLGKKLVLLFLTIGLIPFLIIGFNSFDVAKNALTDSIVNRLLAAREIKREQIENYFETIIKQVKTFSQDKMFIEATEDFTESFNLIEKELASSFESSQKENEDLLRSRYLYQQDNTTNAPENALDFWWPRQKVTKILQHLYISSNPFAIGKKHKLNFAKDQSSYTLVHKKYHRAFSSIVEEFEYYDLFLVDAKSGNIVYSVFKELDYGTNLFNGPYSKSDIGKVFEMALNAKGTEAVYLTDYAPYAPSYNSAASFAASAIYDGDEKVGVLIFQMPIGVIDKIATYGKKWSTVGMGSTSETYIIGPDYKMRTDSRLLLENETAFLNKLKASGYPDDVINNVKKHKTTMGILEIKGRFMEEGFTKKISNYKLDVTNYLDMPVVAAYAPLKTMGLNWIIVVETQKQEAFWALSNLKNTTLYLGVFLFVLVIALGLWFSRITSKSISAVVNTIATTTSQLATTVNEHERVASQQATSVNETTTTMDELNASSRQAAEQAEMAAQGNERAMQLSEEGSATMDKMLEGMAHLKERILEVSEKILNLSEQTNQIGKITHLVDNFANETKMLAMNASVEAVRAGEHGTGFSIVAMEIRKLADESKRSVAQINTIVEEIKKATNSTVMVTEEGTKNVNLEMEHALKTADTFTNVVDSVTISTESARQISLNVKQQAVAIKQVVEAMNNLNAIARETASGIGQTKLAVSRLDDVSQTLKGMV